ncbi:putative leucine-rich repeat-containing protein DDB_G0290503 [Polyergus mexicanus]|uniref:putative leucine-rich repeat-containing protein DDB_G0290503 n=1 Tax=Polyergus mexicanus TaxID=615972 RepID=UPI0038B47452
MCDLIDLNSPDAKGSLDPKRLASPLIPAPKSIESNGKTDSLMITEKRNESDGNNPFDRVLHETVEYVSKKDDPFEVMLQRALKSKTKGNVDLRARSVNFADDFTPRSKKRYFKTRNKTLDGSLLEDKLDMFVGDKKFEERKEIDNLDVRNADVCDNNMTVESSFYKNNDENIFVPKQNDKIVVTNPESLELSILNQSAMNDTLLETVPKSKKDDNTSFFPEKDTLYKEFILLPSNNLKWRSLSQGAGRSPTTLSCLNRRSQSVTDDEKKILQNDYNIVPSFLDKGFLESKYNEQSIFSTLSNVSSIAKLSSISISSSVLSLDTMNHAFLDSNSLKASQENINTSENSLEMKSKQYNLSDLAERLEKLKCTMNGTISISNKIKAESNFTKEEKQITNDKLIDVDVFLPEENSSKERNKSSSSVTSLESVFADTDKVNKSIMNEAKMLSKTFEELAQRTDSGSSVDDDLVSNNTLWMSELLPAFEDDLVVDNLIELPISPEKSSKQCFKNNDKEQSLSNIDKIDENSLKEIEPQFIDCVKQTIVASLLTDLRKLIKVENNSEVNKLLDNLENVIDTNCKNNTELLVTCLNLSNELRSPQKISSDIEKSEVVNIDKSEVESEKISFKEEIRSDEKLSSDINCKLENTSQATINSSENLSLKPSSHENNDDNHLNITNSPKEVYTNYAKEKDNQSDEKLAIELLMNLGKLLNGQVEDATTIQLLKCIGKALNVASNNYKIENEIPDSNKMHNIQQITPKKTSESDRNAHSTKAKHRRSFDRQSKTARRSISVMRSSPKRTSNTQIHKYSSTSEFEDRKKRFSSDSGLVGNLANTKVVVPEACNMEKVEVQSGTKKKEKFIAISDVKNKFKKRTDVVNKRGPMKAVHPVDNMQKKGTLIGKQTTPSSQTITPPKSDKTTPCRKIVSSTPNSMDDKYMAKKSARSQPIASSTPDDQNSKASKAKLTSANKKRNLSCDISPVTAYINTSGSGERKDSPKKPSKLPTPKKCTTPKAEVFGIPKFSTPPRHNLSFNHVSHQRSPQRLNRSLIMDRQRYSPVYQKKSAEKVQQSPLKENRITAKVKPLNLISKLKQHGTGDPIDKENNYA